MPAQPTENPEKLRELILYVVKRSADDPKFGITKLNKLLFFSDFLAYLHFGRPITGAVYQKLKHGPSPRRLKPLLSEMERGGAIRIEHVDYHGHWQHRPVALRAPIPGQFARNEIALTEDVITACWPLSANDISERSHGFLGWRVVDLGETIPYGLALIGLRTPTDAEREYGQSLEATGKEILEI